MNILVSTHSYYNYLDAGIIQGLQILGHNVFSLYGDRTNYVERGIDGSEHVDLYIEFIDQDVPAPKKWPAIHCYGEDHHRGLERAFSRGFQHVFVRDHIPGEPGIPISFGIEKRYYDVTRNGLIPLADREIDICFLGQLCYGKRHRYVEQLKKDFDGYNLRLGPRSFTTPDDNWSQWTLPWSAHDVQYFQTLANSIICLAFKGMGPDTGRLYECLASGAIVVAESFEPAEMVGPEPAGVLWFSDYDELCRAIEEAFGSICSWLTPYIQDQQMDRWLVNRKNHSTAARARYLLEQIGMSS